MRSPYLLLALAAAPVLWAAPGPSAEERAIAYLAREVPQWSKQNHCYSCHNNGDGARSLYTARRLGYRVADEALADTTRWLARPGEWDNSRGDPAFSDKKLARIQFAASLVEAIDARAVEDREALVEAAGSLLSYQEADGSWRVDAGAALGSPVTWGAPLATHLAGRALEKADAARFAEPIARARRWLLETRANSVLDAAAVVMALAASRDPRAEAKVRQCLEMIRAGQASDGGWGPQAKSPPEAFDTAVALLALATVNDRAADLRRIERGRAHLIRTQLSPGGWPETTRPPGSQSYAQHLSTSAWAALALIETRRAVETR